MASKCAQRKTARLVRIRELRIMVSILDQLQKSNLIALQKSVGECVKMKNYDFKVAKISNEGKVTFE